jgi:glycosyltransferase involved in cell wall biosynthesis
MSDSPARRILYLDHTSVLAGGEIALLNLVRHLDRDRFLPVAAILSDGPFIAELTAAGVETHLLAASRGLLETRKDAIGGNSLSQIGAIAASAIQIARLIRSRRIDLIHANSLKANLLGGVAARLTGQPIIWHLRDRIEDDYLSPAATKIVRISGNIFPTHVIANSHATLATLKLFDSTAGSVIYSGLDLSPFLIPTRAINTIRPRIGIIGRLTEWKGQHIFLQAAAMVRRKFPAANFQIVGSALFGETDYEARLHKLAEELSISAATEFAGFRRDLPELLGQMDVVVHASITGEPFGQVVVQAMAAARPVIATAGGGIPEIVMDGKTGLLVPMNDAPALAEAICRVLNHPDLAMDLGRQGRRRAMEHFTIERTAGQTMELYDRVLAGF